MKVFENLLKSHESNSKRNLQNIRNNILRITQKLGNCKSAEIENDIREIRNQMQILVALIGENTDFNIKTLQVYLLLLYLSITNCFFFRM